jgi:hypothetical protein
MRPFLVLLPVLAMLPGTGHGQPPASVRDPWRGFGLGSIVQTRTQAEYGGKTVKDELGTPSVERVPFTALKGREGALNFAASIAALVGAPVIEQTFIPPQ